MKILLIGASGMIGRAVSHALTAGHDLITASRSSGDLQGDISHPASLPTRFPKTGRGGAILRTAGDGATPHSRPRTATG